MGNLFEELKRRNVFRVGFAYLVVGWLMIEVVDTIAPRMAMPEWVPGLVIILVLVGLPITLFLAWAFEMTPEGVKKTNEVDADESITPSTGKKLIKLITAALFLSLAFIAWDKLGPAPGPESAQDTVAEVTQASIAVLPFVNMSSDPEQEYFSDGISEELLNVLAKIDGLKVAARTSSFSFKGQNRPVGEIAEVLGVGHILEGSVRKSGTQIRITAQLIRVSDGFHMWSESYDRELVNIFAIQDEIAQAIVSELRVRLESQAPIRSTTTDNAEAYQEYLKGRYFWNLRATENLYRAIAHFERATELDPTFVDAWVGLGETWILLPVWEFNDAKAPEQLARARLAAEKALMLNPKSGRAHAVLAYAHMLKLEYRESLVDFELALKYRPGDANAWQWYGGALNDVGRFDRAREALQKAIGLEPLSRIIGTSAADKLISPGRYDAALDRVDQTLAFAPDFWFAWQIKGFAHLAKHEFDKARAAFLRMSELIGTERSEIKAVDLVEEFVRTGEPGQSPDWLYDRNLTDPYYASFILVSAGQYEAALDLIEQQSAANIPHLATEFLNSVLYREAMGDNPRYQELVERLATFDGGSD